MAEKAAGKKDHQKNKKDKQNEKKKNQANGIKQHGNKSNQNQKQQPQKKKEKKTKPVSKKKSFSFLHLLFNLFILNLAILMFMYIVDYERFCQVKVGAGYIFNKTVSLLPEPAVAKGRDIYEIVRPTAELTISKVGGVINETSTFLNTNPLIKDHWANVRDIGLICSTRLADYMRTVYIRVCGYCLDLKNKFM